MMEYITADRLTVAFTAFLIVWQVGKSALRFFAPRTGTTADDAALAWMESAEQKVQAVEESQWIKSYAPAFWAQVEALSMNTKLPSAAKAALYLKMAHDAYIAAKGKTLSVESVKTLETLAAGMSATAKLPNPQPAPVSR